MRRTSLLCLAIFTIGVTVNAGCSGAQSRRPARELAPGNHEFTIRHAGRSRTYLVHVPVRAADRPAVIIAFHGGGGNAVGFQEYAELDAIADRERFLVVYPNGTGPLPRRLLTWNAGDGCCGYALTQKVDDVGFAVAVIDDLERRTAIDRHRIYATGHSNGGIMSHRLAAERPDFVAAVAPVAGSLDLTQFSPRRAVPVLQIHSVDDPRALYNGGMGPPFPGTDNRVFHQPVQAASIAGSRRIDAAHVRIPLSSGEVRPARERPITPRPTSFGARAPTEPKSRTGSSQCRAMRGRAMRSRRDASGSQDRRPRSCEPQKKCGNSCRASAADPPARRN